MRATISFQQETVGTDDGYDQSVVESSRSHEDDEGGAEDEPSLIFATVQPQALAVGTNPAVGSCSLTSPREAAQGQHLASLSPPPPPEIMTTMVEQVSMDGAEREPPPPQTIEVDEQCPGPLKYRKVQTAMVVILAIVSMSVMSAYIAVVVQTNNTSSSSSSSSSVSGSSSDEDVRPTGEDSKARLVEITNLLMERGLATPSSFLEARAPRTRTVDWLVYEDQTGVPLEDTTEEIQNRFLQRYALMLFAYSTGVELWQTVNRWTEMVDTHECSFSGIECNLDGQVVAISLPLWRLSGTIPHEMGFVLTKLTSLNLSQNKLEGSIPESLYELTGLETIAIFGNSLGSTISPKIQQLSNLKMLYLGSNQFEGPLPISSLQALTQLLGFDVSDTFLEGPVFDAILSWPQIQAVSVTDARNIEMTTIPSEIGELTDLKDLLLTQIHPQLPTEIGRLTMLEVLYMFSTGEGGSGVTPQPLATIPSEIGQLTRLEQLSITGGDSLEGTIPTEVGLLTSLEWFDFFFSNIGGHFPSEVGLLTNLKFLSVAACENMEGTIPSEVGNIARGLEIMFDISGTRLEGTLPKEFCASNGEIRMQCRLVQCSCCSSTICVN